MSEPVSPDELRLSLLQSIERCRELQSQTKNPVYFWMALSALNVIRQSENEHLACEQPLILPGWCAEYFSAAAWDLFCLANGLDQAREGVAGQGYPKLTSDAAMRLIPQALGFSRQGYSAFDQVQSMQELMKLFNRFEDLRSMGETSADAVEVIMFEFGLDEERTARRRIAAGRRYVKGERPEEKGAMDKT